MQEEQLVNLLDSEIKVVKVSSGETAKYHQFIANSRQSIDIALGSPKKDDFEGIRAEILMRINRERLKITAILKIMRKLEETKALLILKKFLINEWKIHQHPEEDGGKELNEAALRDYLNFRSHLVDLPSREYGAIAQSIRRGLNDRKRGHLLAKTLKRCLLENDIKDELKTVIRVELKSFNSDVIKLDFSNNS